ncbi:MAG TPA: sulfur carrier protein ThiS [Candidatus Dormibacteraeota bacterium]|nr:sulfur carrier protein ThiS [Candidatus Dormibacteraeota bacterium]
MITVQINGKRVELEQPTPLLAYLKMLGVDERAVAVEHNRVILERDLYASTILGEGDTVEIVRMVGGGRSGDEPDRDLPRPLGSPRPQARE